MDEEETSVENGLPLEVFVVEGAASRLRGGLPGGVPLSLFYHRHCIRVLGYVATARAVKAIVLDGNVSPLFELTEGVARGDVVWLHGDTTIERNVSVLGVIL